MKKDVFTVLQSLYDEYVEARSELYDTITRVGALSYINEPLSNAKHAQRAFIEAFTYYGSLYRYEFIFKTVYDKWLIIDSATGAIEVEFAQVWPFNKEVNE